MNAPMNIVGIDRVVLGVDEMDESQRFLTDFGLKKVEGATAGARFSTQDGTDLVVRLANDTVTAVRRRVTWELRNRRGRKIDPEWANRRRLLTARERLRPAALSKMWTQLLTHDPTGQILAAWIAKEELRTLLSTVRRGGDAHLTRHRLHRFFDGRRLRDHDEFLGGDVPDPRLPGRKAIGDRPYHNVAIGEQPRQGGTLGHHDIADRLVPHDLSGLVDHGFRR